MCGSPIPFANPTHKHRANYLLSRFSLLHAFPAHHLLLPLSRCVWVCAQHTPTHTSTRFGLQHSFCEHLQTALGNSIHFQLEEPHFHPSSQTGNFFLSDLLPSFPTSNFFFSLLLLLTLPHRHHHLSLCDIFLCLH